MSSQYDYARDLCGRGDLVVCLPITRYGEPAVAVCPYEVDHPYVQDVEPEVRASFLIGALQAARGHVAEVDGVENVSG